MAKYIELEAAIQAAKEPTIYDLTDVPEWLSSLPAADVAPVVHGRWIWSEENECLVCSNCEMSALNNYRGISAHSNYCHNCGARMDGE